MGSAERRHLDRDAGAPTRRARARLRAAAIRERADRLARRTEEERRRHGSVDAAFEMVDRDAEVGGGIIAGALAYRFFIWLLPLALVAVAGLGIAADASSDSPRGAADSLGLAGLVSSSVARAADSPTRWYALLVGIPVLLVATRSALRVLIGAHRLVWLDPRSAAPRPGVAATLRFLGLMLAFFLLSALATAVRARTAGPGVLVTVVMTLPYAGIWLLVSARLPHRVAPWTALVPGALLVGVGVEALHVAAAYVIAPWGIAKQGTYGVLGLAAALLVGLFLFARLLVSAAIVDATLWERRTRSHPAQPGSTRPAGSAAA